MKRLILAAAVAAGAVLVWTAIGRGPDRLSVQSEVIRAVTANGASSLQATPLAGVSARADIAVQPVDPRALGSDTLTRDYHHFRHRCLSCHQAPAPSMHTAGEWPAIVDRMNANLAAAGLLGLSAEEREAIVALLGRHARRR